MAAETKTPAKSTTSGKESAASASPETPATGKVASSASEATGADRSQERTGRARAIIRRNVLWSLGAGIVPIPLLDALAVTGVQVKMLAELSKEYDIPFKEGVAKKLVGALLSGLGGTTIGVLIGSSLAKLAPGIGTAVGIVTAPLVAGAFTQATGSVFMMHFEAGGTLLDFDPYNMRKHFRDEFERAKKEVERIQKEKQESQATAA